VHTLTASHPTISDQN